MVEPCIGTAAVTPAGAGQCKLLCETPDRVTITLTDGTIRCGPAVILPPESGLFRSSSILILGEGPAALDCAVQLLELGHCGPIYLLSRHGRIPCAEESHDAFAIDLADVPIGTSLPYLLHWLRSLVRWCKQRGYDWPSVVDGIKPHAGAIWQHLSAENRRRFVAHARPWWDAHVHRLTPSAAAIIRTARASGQLTVLSGRVISVAGSEAEFGVIFKPRGSSRYQRLVIGKRHGERR
jgi:uncharacterized NAD(P)/FAD-binding protein YdhS